MRDIVCTNRDKVREILKKNDIISRPLGVPLYTEPYLKGRTDYTSVVELQKKMLFLPGAGSAI